MPMLRNRARTSAASRAALVTLALLTAAPAAAERVPGMAVTLEPPPGFVPSKKAPGFQQDATGSSIVVTEVAGPVAGVTAAMTPDGLATQGMRLLESTETTAGGRSALLLHVAQTDSGIEFEKWMIAFGERDRTILVVAKFPKEVAESLREPMRAALLSVEWSPKLDKRQTAGLPFAVSETAELKIYQRVGNTLLLAKQGASVTVDPAEPLVVCGTASHDIAITNVEDFARDRVRRMAQIDGLANVTGEALRIDGLLAYELRAEASDEKSGTPVRVYQLLVADGRRYFLVQGLVGTTQAERFMPQFRQIGRSLRRIR